MRILVVVMALATNLACSVSLSGRVSFLAPLNRESASSDVHAVDNLIVARALLQSGQTDDETVGVLRAAGMPEAEARRIVTLARGLIGGKP